MPRLLLSTFSAVLAVSLGRAGTPARVRAVAEGAGIYFGLARSALSVYVVARNRDAAKRILCPDRPTDAIQLHDRFTLRPRGWRLALPGFADLHQIARIGRRMLVVTAKPPFLLSVDLTSGAWHGIPVAEALPPDLVRAVPEREDAYHFNSVRVTGDALHLLAHNWGPESFALTLDLGEALAGRAVRRAVHRRVGSWAHDILPAGGRLWTLDSGGGALVSLEPERRVHPIPDPPGRPFPRGLAAAGGHLYVAYGLFDAERGGRMTGPSRIARFDLAEGRFDADWEIGAFGNTCDLLPL